MRVISLVPSWTETLVDAGVEVIGRTRFCIHPKDRLAGIPVVGGTKDWDLEKIRSLNPDLVVLDEEENPKFMSEAGLPSVATHVTSVETVPTALRQLRFATKNLALEKMAVEWDAILARPALARWNGSTDLPGVLEWGRKPTREIERVFYVIWRDPWMVVSRDTFIASILEKCGLEGTIEIFHSKYPKIELESLPRKESTLLLFSSEPFPFLKKREGLGELGCPYAIVDGEKFSWFGSRSLAFLKPLLS